MDLQQACTTYVSFLSGNNPTHTRFIPWRLSLRIAAALITKSRSIYRLNVGQHKMFADLTDSGVSTALFLRGGWEEFETQVARSQLKEGDVALDIGAHIGYYSLIFARAVGKSGKVFAFEPSPSNCRLLRINIETNGYGNVIVVQGATSDKTGTGKLYLSSEKNLGDHRIYDPHDGRAFESIETVRLDDYFKDYSGSIDFVKMDIQGAEYATLQGMRSLIRSKGNPSILMEFWPLALKETGANPRDLLDWVRANGYDIWEVRESEKKLVRTNSSTLMDSYGNSRHSTNLLLKRS